MRGRPMIRKLVAFTAWLGAALVVYAGGALAMEGQPEPWQMGLQPAGDELMARIISLHTGVLYIITIICLFVLGLLVWIAMRFNANANPTPSETTHNTVLEVLWTIIPVAILVAISIPSFRLLYFE